MNLKQYTDQHSQAALAKAIGASPSFVNQWVQGIRDVPIPFCTAIERATGGKVSRAELRTDDYWLIWPDLPIPKTMTKDTK